MARTPGTSRPHDDAGMSLVEVLMAVVVLGILSTAVLGVLLQTQSANRDSRARTAAASLASREIDLVREEFARTTTAPIALADAGVVTNPHPLTGQPAGQALVLDGMPYTVTRSAAWNVTGPGRSACEGGSLVQHPTLGVTVTVTWPDMGTTRPVVSQVQLAPPKGTGVSTAQAFVAVKVVDSDGAAHAGRTVRVSGGGTTRSGLTDTAGCAVVAVTPLATGTDYTAQLGDVGYVDVNGNATPSKTTGAIRPGQLGATVTFAYDRAATLRVRIVNASGVPYPDASVQGTGITVVATESAGSSASRPYTATGAVTSVPGLWPTRYGAHFGSTPPAGGYESVDLAPGSTGDVDVVLALADFTVGDLPPGTASVVAVPGTATCTDAGARPVDPAGASLVPGSWSFYAAGPSFDCATGPGSRPLTAGDNGEILFATSTLRITGAPAAGGLWAVHASRVPGLTTCPGPAAAGVAVDVNAARTADMPLAAGDWFIYRTDGPPEGACQGLPRQAYPKNVAYGAQNELAWVDAPPPVQLTVTEASTGSGSRYRIFLSRTPVTLSTCRTTLPTGAIGLAPENNPVTSGLVEPGQWYVYRQRTDSTSCTQTPGNPRTLPALVPGATLNFRTGEVTAP